MVKSLLKLSIMYSVHMTKIEHWRVFSSLGSLHRRHYIVENSPVKIVHCCLLSYKILWIKQSKITNAKGDDTCSSGKLFQIRS